MGAVNRRPFRAPLIMRLSSVGPASVDNVMRSAIRSCFRLKALRVEAATSPSSNGCPPELPPRAAAENERIAPRWSLAPRSIDRTQCDGEVFPDRRPNCLIAAKFSLRGSENSLFGSVGNLTSKPAEALPSSVADRARKTAKSRNSLYFPVGTGNLTVGDGFARDWPIRHP